MNFHPAANDRRNTMLTEDERAQVIDTGRHVYGCCSDGCDYHGAPEDTQIRTVEAILAAREGVWRAPIEALATEWERQARILSRRGSPDRRHVLFACFRALRAALGSVSAPGNEAGQ